MTVPERRGGVARVDDLAAVAQPEPGPVPAHHPQVLGLAGGQAGRDQKRCNEKFLHVVCPFE